MAQRQPVAPLLIAVLLLAAALIAAGFAFRHTVSCFLLAFILAYLLDPLVLFLERRRIPRIHAIAILYVLLNIFALFCFAYLVPFLTLRWEALLRDLPRYFQKGKEILLAWEFRFRPPYATEEWNWFVDTVSSGMDKVLAKLGAGFYAAATRFVFNLFTLILAPILVFFMLQYKEHFKAVIADWLPADRREAILALGREINASIGAYLRGQLLISLIVAVLATLTLFLLDVDYPLLNGIFAGLASILPFIGVFIATLPPLFFAYVKFQSGLILLKVIGAFGIIYFLEGYVVKPLVFKGAMNLNPLVTILTVMAFGELMGFWGILLAIPIAAALKIFIAHLRHGDFDGEPVP